MNLFLTLEQNLKKEPNFVTDTGELKKWVVLNKAHNYDEGLIEILLGNSDLKKKFFIKVKETLVFNQSLFVQFLEQKNFLNDSYTQFKNKVGLTSTFRTLGSLAIFATLLLPMYSFLTTGVFILIISIHKLGA